MSLPGNKQSSGPTLAEHPILEFTQHELGVPEYSAIILLRFATSVPGGKAEVPERWRLGCINSLRTIKHSAKHILDIDDQLLGILRGVLLGGVGGQLMRGVAG